MIDPNKPISVGWTVLILLVSLVMGFLWGVLWMGIAQ